MCAARENVLIIDMSVLPIRPDVGKVKKFLENQIKLQYAEVKSIQLHNTRNCVIVELVDKAAALRYQLKHNLKHSIVAADKEYKIPVYVDGDAVTVRVHDLPTSVSHQAIRNHMIKFGEILSIRDETWKHYFPGIPNGVRVLRMNLFRPIPTLITIGNDNTTVSYFNQPKSSRQPAHTNTELDEMIDTEQNDTQQNDDEDENVTNETNDDDDSDNTSNSSTDYIEVTSKRRRSNKKERDAKKVCADQCSSSTHVTGHEEKTVGTSSKGNGVFYQIKSRNGFKSIYNRR